MLLLIEVQNTAAKRKVDIRIFDRSYTASKEEVERKLAKAVLTKRGYRKITVFTQSAEDEPGEPFQKIERYQKSVSCQDMGKVEEELRASMPGIWGSSVSMKVRKEAKAKRGKDHQCTAGIEIHFPSKRCPQNRKKVKRQTCKNGNLCVWCFYATVQ